MTRSRKPEAGGKIKKEEAERREKEQMSKKQEKETLEAAHTEKRAMEKQQADAKRSQVLQIKKRAKEIRKVQKESRKSAGGACGAEVPKCHLCDTKIFIDPVQCSLCGHAFHRYCVALELGCSVLICPLCKLH